MSGSSAAAPFVLLQRVTIYIFVITDQERIRRNTIVVGEPLLLLSLHELVEVGHQFRRQSRRRWLRSSPSLFGISEHNLDAMPFRYVWSQISFSCPRSRRRATCERGAARLGKKAIAPQMDGGPCEISAFMTYVDCSAVRMSKTNRDHIRRSEPLYPWFIDPLLPNFASLPTVFSH
jgi:hypothetical protein